MTTVRRGDARWGRLAALARGGSATASLTSALSGAYASAVGIACLAAFPEGGPLVRIACWIWIASGLALASGAVAAGRRFPVRAGATLILATSLGVSGVVAGVASLPQLLTPLLLAPAAAAYLGWTLRPRAARGAFGVILAAHVAALAANPLVWHVAAEYPWLVAFGFLSCVIVLELSVAIAVEMRRVTRVDPLTGAWNRRGLEFHVARMRREGGGRVWIATVDLDGLKRVNDAHGHAAGDAMLRGNAAAWTRALASRGIVARWGGDEFVFAFRAGDGDEALEVVDAVRRASPHAASSGVTELGSGSLADAVRAADVEMYRDKRGRAGGTAALPPAPAAPPQGPLTKRTSFTTLWIVAAGVVAVSALVSLATAVSAAGAAISTVNAALAITVAVTIAVRRRPLPSWAAIGWVLFVMCANLGHAAVAPRVELLVQLLFLIPLTTSVLGTFASRRAARLAAAAVAVVFAGAEGAAYALTDDIGLLPAVVAFSTGWILLESILLARDGLARAANTDDLTGAVNRRGLEAELGLRIRRARRRGQQLAVAAIDFDGFKAINDRHGHLRGDDALRGAVSAWRMRLRRGDVIARVGGDEFVIVLPAADEQDAHRILALLRRGAAEPWSWGVAMLRAGDTADALLERADLALLAARGISPG